jgi:CHAD domain-containing protein
MAGQDQPGEARGLDEVLLPAAKALTGEMRGIIDRARNGPRGAIVHDLRVCARRLEAVLAVVGEFSSDQALQSEVHLKDLTRGTGKARDAEIKAQMINSEVERLPPDVARIVTALVTAARKEARAAKAKVLRLLRSPAAEALVDSLEASLVESIGESKSLAGTRPGPYAIRVVRRRLKAVSKACAGLDGKSRPSEFHDARLRIKALRYCAELFSELLPPDARAVHKQAAKLQSYLGQVQDLAVVRKSLAKLRVEPAGEGGAGWDEAAAVMLAHMRRRSGRMRRKFLAEYERLAGSDWHDVSGALRSALREAS